MTDSNDAVPTVPVGNAARVEKLLSLPMRSSDCRLHRSSVWSSAKKPNARDCCRQDLPPGCYWPRSRMGPARREIHQPFRSGGSLALCHLLGNCEFRAGLVLCLFTRFLLRFTHQRWRHLEQALLWFAVLATAGMYAAFRGLIPVSAVIGLWLLVWIPGSIVLLVLSTRHALQVRSFPAVMAALVMWTYIPVTLRDLLISANLLPFDTSYLGHYVGIPLVVLIAWMLVDRAVDALQEAGQAEIGRQRAAFDERQRITQDMHDGLGLLLTSSLCQVDAGDLDRARLADSLRACCEELRLIVDSSSVGPAEFLPILATLRHRMQSRLESTGIKVNWRMDAFPPDLVLPQRTSLQLLRIVQEAINNAIKHAKASAIDIAAVDTAGHGQIAILIRDNGVGFDTHIVTPGKGVSGMMRRAASIPATLDIRSSSCGTSVEIAVPVDAAPPGQGTR